MRGGNLIKLINKFLCRVFHAVEYAIKPLLPYHVPEMFDDIDVIPQLLAKHNIRTVLLLTDAQLRSAGVTATLEELLSDGRITC